MQKAGRVVHYINQFFAGRGGEDKAGEPFAVASGPVGPGQAFQAAFGEAATIVATLSCGDNRFQEDADGVIRAALDATRDAKADLFLAGPAFTAGRYGVACGRLCEAVRRALGIPAVTGMYRENPAVEAHRRQVAIVATGASAAAMKDAVDRMARFALRRLRGAPIGPAAEEGTFPSGYRHNHFLAHPGATRAVEMLLAKLRAKPFATELELPRYTPVTPAPPLRSLAGARIAIVTEAGIVPRGNPDRLEWARASKWLKYPLAGLSDLTPQTHEAIHGGFDNTWTNADPDRILGVDVLRELEGEGAFGSLHDVYYVTMGNGSDLHDMQRFGREIAAELKAAGVHGVISPAT